MPIFVIPDSAYGDRQSGARLTREFNPCHDPKNGQFAHKGQGDCEAGSPDDPARNRAIFGQLVPDAQALAFDEGEAARANSSLQAVGGKDTDDIKDEIAKNLATALMAHPDGVRALVSDVQVGDFPRRYSPGGGPPDPESEAVRDQYAQDRREFERAKGMMHDAPDPESEDVRGEYEDYQGNFSIDAPDPEDAQSDYESYREDEMEQIDIAARDDAYDEGAREFKREGDRLAERDEEWYDKAAEAIQARIAELEASGELGTQYGDVSTHPTLPGLDVERPGADAALAKYSQKDLTEEMYAYAQGEKIGEPDYLHDTAFLRAVAQHGLPAFSREAALEGTEFDPDDEPAKQEYIDQYVDNAMEDVDYSSIPSFDSWYEEQYGFDPDEYAERSTPDSFSDWYGKQYGIAPTLWVDTSGQERPTFKSFDAWYADRHGISPAEWSKDDDTQRQWLTAAARNVASGLIGAWASTSGDSDTKSVMLQIAAERHFKLGATYATAIRGGQTGFNQTYERAGRLAEKHQAVLSTFLQKMYDSTQTWLKEQGIGGKDGYVTLYRGFGIRFDQEPGIKTVDTKNGSVVDVLLQPMSSFSSNYRTSLGFGSGDIRLISAMRVPITRIIGTARTGYGCLNESEFVVLGGRYASYVQASQHAQQEAKFLQGSHRFRPRGRTTLGPGDRG